MFLKQYFDYFRFKIITGICKVFSKHAPSNLFTLSVKNKYQRSSLSQMRYKAANLQYFFWENGNGMLFLVRLQTLQFYYRTGRNHRSFSLKFTKCIGTATLHQKWSFYGPYFSAIGSNTKIFAVIFFRTLLMSLIMWINWSRIVLLKED